MQAEWSAHQLTIAFAARSRMTIDESATSTIVERFRYPGRRGFTAAVSRRGRARIDSGTRL
jgi:hypothetical protein